MRVQRTLSTTAAPVPFGAILNGLGALFCRDSWTERFSEDLRKTLQVKHVFLVSSGKAALTLILRGLQRLSAKRNVVIPAYTCFSVPSAVVKAGLDIALCDVNPATLAFDPTQLERALDDQTLCVLPTHFYGLPAELERLRQVCRSREITVVEDAAQAMGSLSGGRWLGTTGDVGFYSLGRGKNLSSGGGGIVVTDSPVIAQAIQAEYDLLPTESWWSAIHNLLVLVATSVLISPHWYWLPAGLPWLELGETIFYKEFPIERMADARAATLIGWSRRLDAGNRGRREQAMAYIRELSELRSEAQAVSAGEACYLRFPLLLRDRQSKEAFCDRAKALGLGASPGYPATIDRIPELAGRFAQGMYPGSAEVVDRLVTLPTHCYVRPTDRKRIREVLETVRSVSGRETADSTGTIKGAVVKAGSR